MDKIGVGIITYNSERYFEQLFNSLPIDPWYDLVVVNGGQPYTKSFKRFSGSVKWIQHDTNKGSAASRNDALHYLYEQGCEHLFLIEDDMIIKSPNIFKRYIEYAKISGLEYLNFASYAWDSGHPFARTPKVKVGFSPEVSIWFYSNMCNEFTYRTRGLYERIGPYREDMTSLFDCEWVYRASLDDKTSPFWYFPDIADSDDLIMNNPESTSRLDADGNRMNKLEKENTIFFKEHKCMINNIPLCTIDELTYKLKKIKNGH